MTKEKNYGSRNTRKFTKHWLTRRNKYKMDKYGHIVGEIETNKILDGSVPITNAFAALSQEQQTKDTGDKVNENKGDNEG